jgi:L-fuculose-phosphate aldolase
VSGAAQHRRHAAGEPGLAAQQRALLDVAHELHRRGWVANHDGNVSLRLPAGRFLLSPTALSKRTLTLTDLIVVDRQGRVLQGQRRPFSEWSLHGAVYDARPDVRAVVHAHPPASTALAVMDLAVEPRILAEAVVSLGDRVPLVPYGLPGSAAQLEALAQVAAKADAATLAQHGALTWGGDLETALLRLELVEHLAEIGLRARQLGALRLLPEADVGELLRRRARAGLGPAGRGAAS